ncbi:hypothetical protein MCHLDSM_00309 [Mycolicibacterium chlorophenolicum]|uniref:Uncharacterized protein n=1 Tax=Mycolicibacterium chlorophenolicum TaxID=37916 RepID=A0A0J6WPM8_9MYCO|nr:hypothetical protein MCHLDSM_00309 [Mycolicibacterium chlorophenolicum]
MVVCRPTSLIRRRPSLAANVNSDADAPAASEDLRCPARIARLTLWRHGSSRSVCELIRTGDARPRRDLRRRSRAAMALQINGSTSVQLQAAPARSRKPAESTRDARGCERTLSHGAQTNRPVCVCRSESLSRGGGRSWGSDGCAVQVNGIFSSKQRTTAPGGSTHSPTTSASVPSPRRSSATPRLRLPALEIVSGPSQSARSRFPQPVEQVETDTSGGRRAPWNESRWTGVAGASNHRVPFLATAAVSADGCDGLITARQWVIP